MGNEPPAAAQPAPPAAAQPAPPAQRFQFAALVRALRATLDRLGLIGENVADGPDSQFVALAHQLRAHFQQRRLFPRDEPPVDDALVLRRLAAAWLSENRRLPMSRSPGQASWRLGSAGTSLVPTTNICGVVTDHGILAHSKTYRAVR
jgi:hypothetical protein